MTDRDTPVDDDPRAAPIRRFIDECVDDDFLEQHSASAVGVGQKGSGTTAEPCLVVYVDQSATKHSPKPMGNTVEFNDPETGKRIHIPVEVVKSGPFRFNNQPSAGNAKLRVPGGVGFSVDDFPGSKLPQNTATLGGWVWYLKGDCAVVVSNEHAMGNDAGRPIYHPPFVPQAPHQRLGQVIDGTRTVNGKQCVDCAIASVDDLSRAQFSVHGIGPAVMRTGAAHANSIVEKMGHATGRTRGRISSVHNTARVRDLTNTFHTFTKCIIIDPVHPPDHWAEDGDSGALVFDAADLPGRPGTHAVVGLHFGCTQDTPPRGIACGIHDVFEALNLSTLPEGLMQSLAVSAMGPGVSVANIVGMMTDFRTRLPGSEAGKRLLAVLDANQEEFVTLLSHDSQLRLAAVGALRATFGNAEVLDEVLGSPLGDNTIASIRAFAELLLARSDEDLQTAINGSLVDLPDGAVPVTLGTIFHADQPVSM